MTFSEQIVYAMFKPSKYKEMLELKKSRFALFIVVLMLAIGIVRFAIPTTAMITGFGGFENLFTKKISPLEFKDGKLSIEKKFEMSLGLYKVVIDTEDAKIPDEKLNRKGGYIAFGSEYVTVAVNSGNSVTRYQEVYLDNILMDGFDNNSLKQLIPFIYTYIVISFIVSCVGYFLKYALLALLFGLFINSINNNMGLGLSKKDVFKICFYGQTLGIIISNFNAALGFLPTAIVSGICIAISINMISVGTFSINKMNQI
ncbi:MAG: DUF1189 family protein [Lachnospiraceae bacterium]|nr:DUF1189 family protein [Lachnospiraceae bacterium]